jgi:hypothetical protein
VPGWKANSQQHRSPANNYSTRKYSPSLPANSNGKNQLSEREVSSVVSNYNLQTEIFILKKDLGISLKTSRKAQGSFASYYNKNNYSSFQNSQLTRGYPNPTPSSGTTKPAINNRTNSASHNPKFKHRKSSASLSHSLQDNPPSDHWVSRSQKSSFLRHDITSTTAKLKKSMLQGITPITSVTQGNYLFLPFKVNSTLTVKNNHKNTVKKGKIFSEQAFVFFLFFS